ncbi:MULTISPECIES: hypothetical protein [Synechococcaceae]|uniref:hypothetical protein n=1 Tax=Synechococcaceae TaxID=1890426 RepID=UPI00223B340E|nr:MULTISPECIES: hypothetical protein [Synechococcaceae]MCT0201795.1 hypothetical protein [Synechococcus sp. CS-603]MCT4368288.1 hypothetical protein [Candidatus Regnicoccus frigidus MAG-AL2]
MKNLIVTTAVGYQPSDIWAFLASAEAHCPDAEIIAIVRNQDLINLEPCCARFTALTLHPIKTALKPLQHFQGFVPKIRRIMARLHSKLLRLQCKFAAPLRLIDEQPSLFGLSSQGLFILNRRFFIARSIIRQLSEKVDSILLSDSRDVIFQGDPFASMGESCNTGMEYRTISESTINAEWIRITYGEDGLNMLSNQTVLCSGVTIGDRESILSYLDLFCDEIAKTVCLRCSLLVPIWDQAYHNMILRYPSSVECQKIPWYSDLATVGEVPAHHLEIDAENIVLVAGSKPKILHQYDRHPAIAAQISLLYGIDCQAPGTTSCE